MIVAHRLARSRSLAPLSTDRAAQQRALAALKPWGTTGLHDAIIESIDAIQAAKGRRALVLLSDGSDRYSKASASDALDRARRSDVMVYPGRVRPRRRPPLFAELATLTGGRSFQPRDAAQLNTIDAHDRQRAAPPVPARLHAVARRSSRRGAVARDHRPRRPPGVTVRARDGYLAK